jgi:hypothetical protein
MGCCYLGWVKEASGRVRWGFTHFVLLDSGNWFFMLVIHSTIRKHLMTQVTESPPCDMEYQDIILTETMPLRKWFYGNY